MFLIELDRSCDNIFLRQLTILVTANSTVLDRFDPNSKTNQHSFCLFWVSYDLIRVGWGGFSTRERRYWIKRKDTKLRYRNYEWEAAILLLLLLVCSFFRVSNSEACQRVPVVSWGSDELHIGYHCLSVITCIHKISKAIVAIYYPSRSGRGFVLCYCVGRDRAGWWGHSFWSIYIWGSVCLFDFGLSMHNSHLGRQSLADFYITSHLEATFPGHWRGVWFWGGICS